MSSPNQNENGSGSGSGSGSAGAGGTASPRFRRGSLVGYSRHDSVTGRREEGLGVVLGAPDGEPVVIRPLSADTVFVPAEDVTSASVTDAG